MVSEHDQVKDGVTFLHCTFGARTLISIPTKTSTMVNRITKGVLDFPEQKLPQVVQKFRMDIY